MQAVVFDVDGTLLDSAPGIVAGYAHALAAVGFPVPSEEVLRGDLGPPVGDRFTALGLPAADLDAAVAAYRRYYREAGMQQASVYPGVPELLEALADLGIALGTATAKLTTVAGPFLRLHGLDDRFRVVNGTDEEHRTKPETLDHTLELLGRPDPDRVLMVGDRHSDVAAAHACGVGAVAVRWGYGSAEELSSAGAHHLLDRPDQLLDLLG